MMWNWRQSTNFVLTACLLLTVLWDFLFWDSPLGVSAAIFAGTLTVILVVRAPRLWRTGGGRGVILLTVLALAANVEEPSTLALVMLIMTLVSLVLVSQRAFHPLTDNVSTWVGRWLGLFAALWVRLLCDNILVVRWLFRHPRPGGRLMKVLTFMAWWILPLIGGLIFASLFALANPIIARFFGHLGDFFNHFFDWLGRLSFFRMFTWVLVIVFSYGLLRYRRPRRANKIAVPPVVRPPGTQAAPAGDWLTGPEMIVRVLLVFNLVFAVENVLDIAYLYVGVPLPENMTYKEYSHRGAYTLIATALLAGLFTLVAFRHNGRARNSRRCRWLVYAWIVQNILLLVSTVWRVWVYVVTTEFTRLRVGTMIWCLIVALGFVWIILRIGQNRTNGWLWRVNALTAYGVLFACAFINFDGLIADYNVRHCAQAGGTGTRLDTAYLHHLGTPALPAVRYVQAHNAAYTPEQREIVDAIAADLKMHLQRNTANWRGWTYRRQRLQPFVAPAEAGVR